MAAEKSGAYSWGDINFIDFFNKVGENEVKFRRAVDFWVGMRIILFKLYVFCRSGKIVVYVCDKHGDQI